MKKYFLILFSILIITSCKSLKQTFDSFSITSKPDIFIEEIIKNDIDFNTIFFKRTQFTFDDGNDKKSFRGSIFIQKDKQIIVSITPILGIELFKLVIDPNSIAIVDKMNKQIQYTDFSYFQKSFGMDLDFYTFQNILTNSFFLYPFNLPQSLFKFELSESYENSSILKSKDISHKNNIYQQKLSANNSINKISKVDVLNISNHILLTISYSEYKNIFNDKYFPNNLFLNAIQGKENLTLNIQFSQIEIDGSSSLSPSIPESYVKIYN